MPLHYSFLAAVSGVSREWRMSAIEDPYLWVDIYAGALKIPSTRRSFDGRSVFRYTVPVGYRRTSGLPPV